MLRAIRKDNSMFQLQAKILSENDYTVNTPSIIIDKSRKTPLELTQVGLLSIKIYLHCRLNCDQLEYNQDHLY